MNNVAVLCAVLLACAAVARADVYQFIDGATRRCMDNGGGKKTNPLELWNCVGDEASAKKYGQRWTLVSAPEPYDKYYYIKDLASGLCVDNGYNAPGDGKPPQMWNCVSASSAAKNGQLWDIKCTSKVGYYKVVDISTGECLDNGTGGNAKPLVMWGCYGDDKLAFSQGQMWELKRISVDAAT